MYYMTKRNLLTTIGMLAVVSAFAQKEYPSRAPMTPAMSEYWTPQPPIVTPGKAPAEAIGVQVISVPNRNSMIFSYIWNGVSRKVLKVQIRQEVIAEYFYKVSMRYRSWTTTRTKRMSMVRPEVSISRLLLWSMP